MEDTLYAFPQAVSAGSLAIAEGGATLRDYFAARAPNPPSTYWSGREPDYAARAMWNYQYADAMLAERSKGNCND